MSQQGITVVSVVPSGDGLAENYFAFPVFDGGTSKTNDNLIGYALTDTIVPLRHGADMDDTVIKSLHTSDDSTDYKNTTGKVAQVIITVQARLDASLRNFKIYSAPTTDSVTGAILVFDTAVSDFNTLGTANTKLTINMVDIQNNHFVVIQNTTGVAGKINIPGGINAIVIEHA